MLGVAATVVALMWLGGIRSGDDPVFAETYYSKSVSGLSVGSAVNFRGVPVGKVAAIDFVGNRYKVSREDSRLIYILLELNRNAFQGMEKRGLSPETGIASLARAGLRATVTASGITGLSRIEFDMRHDAAPYEEPRWVPQNTYIPSKVSLLDDFSSAATRVVNQVATMDFARAWSNLNETIEHAAGTVRAAHALLDSHRGEISRIVEDSADAAASLKDFAAELKRNPSAIVRERRADPLEETRR